MERVINWIRQPEYTGENRCYPCTIVNTGIAFVLGGLAATVSLTLGGIILGLSFLAIYARGYLIPGTPQLTQTYFPDRVLRWFGKTPTQETLDTLPDDRDISELGEVLIKSGIVQVDADTEDFELSSQFRDTWRQRMQSVRDTDTARSRLAATIDVDPEQLTFDDQSSQFVVRHDGDYAGRWISEAAFISDLALEPTLAEWISEWDDLSGQERAELLVRTRVFLEHCPACDARLTEAEDVVQSCCSDSVTTVSTECTECDNTVFNGSY